MQRQEEYEIAIIGGGLSGLSCAILLSRAGYSVAVLEKENYPFHKVCGEYLSAEGCHFLQNLGIPIESMNLPPITTLTLSAPSGKHFTTQLPTGGYGISRYSLDYQLSILAKNAGVTILQNTKVSEVSFTEGYFCLHFISKTNGQGRITSKICCAAYGKKSNLDVLWKRTFLKQRNKRLNNYIAVKYHIQMEGVEHVIGLHNFKDGYCGISKIEENKYCLCYMTHANNLKLCGNDIDRLETEILSQNPHLKPIFLQKNTTPDFPITISQINFHKKSQIENHIIMLGDTGGMITPLCGNGMCMALHSGKIAAQLICRFLNGTYNRVQLEKAYTHQWKQNFSRRMQVGRILQKFFGNKIFSNFFVGFFKTFPFLAKPIIKMTQGKPF